MLGLEKTPQQRVNLEQALARKADPIAVDLGQAFVDERAEPFAEFAADLDVEFPPEIRRVEFSGLELKDHLAHEQLMFRDRKRAVQRQFARVDSRPVWSLSCFYTRKGYRRRGVTAALIDAAIIAARRAGAVALEAYPLDPALTPSASHTGFVSMFARAGFKIVARDTPPRPIMRYDLVVRRRASSH